MPVYECPGGDRKTPSVPEEVQCPECGADVEMWSNDTKATCPACLTEFTRDQLGGGD